MIPDDKDDGIYYERYHDYGTGWFVGIIVALALLAIAYLMFSAQQPPVYLIPEAKAERFQYTPGHMEFACEPGPGPVWETLQRDLELMNQRRDDDTSVAIMVNLH